MSAVAAGAPDPYGATVATAVSPGLGLGPFNLAGVLAPADVHVAELLVELAGAPADDALTGRLALAAALAVRAPRLGNVCVDLATIADTLAAEATSAELAALPWPEPASWCAEVAAADALVTLAEAEEPDRRRPLRLLGSRLFLERHWRQERRVADVLRHLDGRPLEPLDLRAVADVLAHLFPDPEDADQRVGAASMALRGLTVLAGGPGTGKTTTVARAVAMIVELARRERRAPPLIALCAPTGKAAARLAESIREQAGSLDVSTVTREHVARLGAGTIHRLLGARGEGRFIHHGANPLPHDLVIVDETSMVSLSLMAHLLAAVRTDARLVFVGDPDQLSAIEAGAVLRDIVGPAADGPTAGPAMRTILTQVTGRDPGERSGAGDGSGFGDGVVLLRRSHRFGSEIGRLADAVRAGDGDGVLAALAAAGDATDAPVRWLAVDPGAPDAEATRSLQRLMDATFTPLLLAARDGDAAGALARLADLRLLCAHRHGPWGVSTWTATVEHWLADALEVALEGDYAGRPLLLTRNDYELRLFNGDTGVVVAGPDGAVSAAFPHDPEPVRVPPARLGSVETAYATTIHKSQGSQFGTAVVIVPGAESRLLSRELLYTAITRARHQLVLVGGAEAIAAAVSRPVLRATGLHDRLW